MRVALVVAAFLLLGASAPAAPYVAQHVAALPANDGAPRDLLIPEALLRQNIDAIGRPTVTAAALEPWEVFIADDFRESSPLPQVSPQRMIWRLQLAYPGANVTLALDAATGRVLVYLTDGTLPQNALTTLATGPCPSYLADSQIDTNIDPEIQGWMRKEAHDQIAGMPPCDRGGLFGGDDASGRFWSNRISAVRERNREHAGIWKWIEKSSWQAPDGTVMPSPHDPVLRPLFGSWNCPDGVYAFGPAGTGHFTSPKQPYRSTAFIYAIDDRLEYQVTLLRIGFGHNDGAEYVLAFESPSKLRLKNVAFYNALDHVWNALPTQPTSVCTRRT